MVHTCTCAFGVYHQSALATGTHFLSIITLRNWSTWTKKVCMCVHQGEVFHMPGHLSLSPSLLSGAVAVKKLNVTNPTDHQLMAFKNEVGVLRCVRGCMCVCVRACVRACMRVCVRVHVMALPSLFPVEKHVMPTSCFLWAGRRCLKSALSHSGVRAPLSTDICTSWRHALKCINSSTSADRQHRAWSESSTFRIVAIQ